jgi:hypothetical protein
LERYARPDGWPAPVYDLQLAQHLRDIGAGLRPWPQDPSKKRHHFVARFVLSRFAAPVSAGGERLTQLDKTTGRCQPVKPEEAASRKRFYAVESDESPRDNRIEDFLSLVEGYAAVALENLLREPTQLSETDRATISLLLALQERRTPYGIAEAGAAIETAGLRYIEHLARDPAAFAEMWTEFRDGRDETEIDVEETRREMLAMAVEGRIHLRNQREQGLLMMMQGWLATAEIIDEMHWHLLRPPDGGEFIQNDQGVARLDRSTTFSTPTVKPQWLFPLAPDACLLVLEGERGLSLPGCTNTGLTDANMRIYAWAERFIFGRSQKAVQDTRSAAKRNPRKASGPPPLRSAT